MASVYDFKPRFQALLRPLVGRLHQRGVSANQVTLLAAVLSLLVAAVVGLNVQTQLWFVLIALWLPLRMALNAIDGMLAREHGQQTALGGYLNELCDVVSDAALFVPFALLPETGPGAVLIAMVLAIIVEYAGVMGPLVGATRRYDGPMGKSDRALVFGTLGLLVALGWLPAFWLNLVFSAAILLLCLTIFNRVKSGLKQGETKN